jgi:hypothetical protein
VELALLDVELEAGFSECSEDELDVFPVLRDRVGIDKDVIYISRVEYIEIRA